jgi:hypothetical protein
MIKPEAGAEWHGEGVSMSEVLAALKDIRTKFALAEKPETEELPNPRNCIMTLRRSSSCATCLGNGAERSTRPSRPM